MKFLKISLVSLLAAGSLFAGTYKVDKGHSNVGFKVKHMVVANAVGKFDEFSGTFEYDEKTNTLKSLSGVVEVASINTENAKRDGHLKKADFLAVDKYPQIKFELTKVEGDYAYGKFTLRGVTKDIKLELENNGSIINHRGSRVVGLSLYGKINRKDFGVSYNRVLEAGGLAVGEIVKLNIDIEGIEVK